MATWKKVIVSGSAAELGSLNISTNQSISSAQAILTGSFTGSFTGDGANLTNVTATATFPSTQISPILSTTQIFANDGSNKYIVVGQITGSTYSGITGDITVNSTGVSAIGSSKVTSTMIVDGTITGTDIASTTVANSNLVNSAITIGTTSTSLGASNTTIVGLVSVTSTGFTGALTGNASTATALATARTIGGVSFDGTANINLPGVNSAGNQNTSGNAATATTLATARNINGTSFNGSADITVTAAATTLTGATLASNVLASSLTSVGTLAGVTVTGTSALTTLTVSGNATITGDLSVAGTASFTNVDNLNIKDKFILINSGSSTLADSGWITQYNAAGSGSAFYLEASSAGTYGRFAVAYDAIGTSTSLTPDEFIVTVKSNIGSPLGTTPTWGGNTNGYGNIYIDSNDGSVYIYS